MIPITRVYGRFFIRVVFFLGFLKENMQGRLTQKKNIQKTQTAARRCENKKKSKFIQEKGQKAT